MAGEPRSNCEGLGLDLCAWIYGDARVDPGVGTGGGAISDKCSGEIDPFSDSSVLAAEFEELASLERVTWL